MLLGRRWSRALQLFSSTAANHCTAGTKPSAKGTFGGTGKNQKGGIQQKWKSCIGVQYDNMRVERQVLGIARALVAGPETDVCAVDIRHAAPYGRQLWIEFFAA